MPTQERRFRRLALVATGTLLPVAALGVGLHTFDRARITASGLLAALGATWVVLAAALDAVLRRVRAGGQQAAWNAQHDHLTGLADRALFVARADAVLRDLDATGESGCLAVFDLTRFTEVNNALGRDHGDALLRRIAGRITRTVGPDVLVARLGGDVFAVLLTEAGGPERVACLRAIRGAMAEANEVAGIPVSLEVSCGVVTFPEDGTDVNSLLRRADLALGESKRNRGGITAFAGHLDTADPARLALGAELRRAIQQNHLLLEYQPKIHLCDMRMHGVEALVRWRHPDRGLISPAEFIPMAEATGLIAPLTTWVMEAAVAQAAAWRAAGLPLRVAVNVSARSLRDEAFPDEVVAILAHHGLPADLFEVEITETAVIDDPERARCTVRRLRDVGVRVALDDFGQGFTSLAHLRSLALTSLKIDKSFIDAMTTDDGDRTIVASVISLSRRLGLEVVAEGVETTEQHELLQSESCDVVQGFLFDRPLPASVITQRFAVPVGVDGPTPPSSPPPQPLPQRASVGRSLKPADVTLS